MPHGEIAQETTTVTPRPATGIAATPVSIPLVGALTPETVLALQRTAGNCAVTRMLARFETPAALDHQVRWRNARTDGDHVELARLTAGFTGPQLEEHLRVLTLEELDAIVRLTGRGGQPAHLTGLHTRAEHHRIVAYRQRCLEALRDEVWDVAVRLLNGLSESDLNAIVDNLTQEQLDGVGPIVHRRFDDNHRVFRRVNYRRWRDALARAHPPRSNGRATDPNDPSVLVPGGGIVTSHSPGDGRFGRDYRGRGAQAMGWLQFGCAEAQRFAVDGRLMDYNENIAVNVNGQPEPLFFGSPTHPAWNVDTFGRELPFVDSSPTGGDNVVALDRQAFWDRPTTLQVLARAAFESLDGEPQVARIVMRGRFVQYLVRGQDIVLRGASSVVWQYRNQAQADQRRPPPQSQAELSAPVPCDRLDADHHAALVRRYPEVRFFRHERASTADERQWPNR